MGFRVRAFNHTEAEVCMANIWGLVFSDQGTACNKRATLATVKEQREGQCGRRAKGNRARGDLHRRPGLEARIKNWIWPEAGRSPWRVLCSVRTPPCAYGP